MTTEKGLTLSQSNQLTMSRYDFSPIEKRCLYHVIGEVRRIYIDNELRPTDSAGKTIFQDLVMWMEPSALSKLGDEVKDVYKALQRLQGRQILIENDEMWLCTSWVIAAKHDKKINRYKVQVSEEILPYLVELAHHFTQYQLTIALALKSTYSQRIYEMCCMYRAKGKFFKTIEDLKFLLMLEDMKSFNDFSSFRRRVFDIAMNEIKALYDTNQCDFYFTWTPKEKSGKKVLSVWFNIHERETQGKSYNAVEAIQLSQTLVAVFKRLFPRDSKYVKRVESGLNQDPSRLQEIHTSVSKIVNKYDAKTIPPVLRVMMTEDYGIS